MATLQKLIHCVVALIAVAGVSGYLTFAYSHGGGISDRLLRLKLLALRLQSRDIARYKAESPEQWYKTGYQATEEWNTPLGDYLSDVISTTKRVIGRKDRRPLNRVEKASNELDMVRSDYAIFHNDLTNFVNALSSKFKDNAPIELNNINIIPAVFRPSDEALVNGNVDKIIEAWFIIRNLTIIVLDNIEKFLKPESIQLFTRQRQTLSIDMTNMDVSVFSLRLSGITYNPNEYVILSAGIGGVNYGAGDAVKYLEELKTRQAIAILLKTLVGDK